jgi:AraC-like DNA-binding protein
MQYLEAKPSSPLAGTIKCFWSIRAGSGSGSPEPVLPDGCPEIVFNLSDRFKRLYPDGSNENQPATIISGQLRSSISIMSTGRVELFGVRFHPGGAYPLLRMPMRVLSDRVEPLDSVIGADADEISETIEAANDFEGRVRAFERFCFERMNGSGTGNDLAARLVQSVIAHRGPFSVSELSVSSGLGERTLERIFQRFVGLSPKTFARIVRFQHVVRRIEAAESESLLDTALDLGYYDQSHMIREFREFAGKSPLAYFEETHRISELFTSDHLSDLYNTA